MNKSAAAAAALFKPISVASPTSTISSSFSSDDYDDQPAESSWATYIDGFQQQQNKNSISFDSFHEEEEDATDLELSWSAKNKMIVKMHKRGTSSSVVDEELEDTACSPHSSPKVLYMNQMNMMKLKTKSNAKEKMRKPALITDINPNKECSELQKRGLCLVPLSSVAFDLDQV